MIMKTDNSKSGLIRPPVDVVRWVGGAEDGYLELLDQSLLPNETIFIQCRNVQGLWDAISRLAVRGAPAIGVASAYGMVLAAQAIGDDEDFQLSLESAGEHLVDSRPTAVNLQWAVRRICRRVREKSDGPGQIRQYILDQAREIHAEDQTLCQAIGSHACGLIQKCGGVLTHCNAGALATAGIGTATAGMYLAHAAGHEFTVYCDETRPLLQGSRLTAWELNQAGIDTVVITDSMAAEVMRCKRVGMVITGADRIAANGDAANKIGTYGLAIVAAHHKIPFYVAAPYSTFDMNISDGGQIPIEQRSGEEITNGFGRRTAPENIKTFSPAFDVTPAELITAVITDRGIIQPVTESNVRKLLG